MLTIMSGGIRRRRRLTLGLATYGVAFVTIALVVLLVQVVGFESSGLFANVSQGLGL